MTNPQQNALAEALERKMARVHPSNRKADLPMMLKVTYGDLEAITQALASNNPTAVEGRGEQFAEIAISYDDAVSTIRAGIRSFISCEPDIDLSPGLERRLAEHILGQPGGRAVLAPAPGQWQPIETAPKEGQLVLVWGFDECGGDDDEEAQPCVYPVRHGPQIGLWWMEGSLRRVLYPSHWMPLPIAPNADREGA